MKKTREQLMREFKAALKYGILAVHPDDLTEIEAYMTDNFDERVKAMTLQAIKYVINHPESIESFKTHRPFSDEQFKDIDWTKVKDVWFEGNILKIEYED